MTNRVRVDVTAPIATGYDVIVQSDVLRNAAAHITAAAPAAAYAVITPDSVAGTHATLLLESLQDADLSAELFTFPDGEAHKTRETWLSLTDRLLERGFGRDACIIAVGGGVAGDIAGFVAATYMRGIPFVQVPTTLLAMIDASVGGKAGVDTAAGKNLVGAFHAPRLVIADPTVLRTLPPDQLRAGMAEAVKHGAILDAQYFEWIGTQVDALFAYDANALEHLIVRSVQLKAAVVSCDPLEHGQRAILNFGHTAAHALEHVTGYSIAHGHAVAVGLCAEAALGEALGVTRAGTADRIEALLTRLGLPTRTDADPAAMVRAMRSDKKVRDARVRFVLLRETGSCARDDGSWTRVVDEDAVKAVLESRSSRADVV